MEYSVFSFILGLSIGYLFNRKTNKKYGKKYTYDGMYKFCGGNPTKFKGIINGKRPAVYISSESDYSDCIMNNMIYYCGTFHQRVSPANPGHQSSEYYMNKFIDDTRTPMNMCILVWVRE